MNSRMSDYNSDWKPIPTAGRGSPTWHPHTRRNALMVAKRFSVSQAIIMLVISLFSLACLLPFLMVISRSLSIENDIVNYGYSLIPRHITFDSYRILFLGSNR